MPKLVFHYRKTGRYALNVLAGALETSPDTRDLPVAFPARPDALVAAIRSALVGECPAVVVGWSFYSPDFEAVRHEFGWVRAQVSDPRVLHVAGGVHATAEPEQTLRVGFDLVAVGEGERIVVELIGALRRGDDIRGVRGLAHLAGGVCVRNGRGEAVDLNAYPPFAEGGSRFGPIEITRGCIYACRFCQTPFMNKARFRHRSVENVCRYVRTMVEHGWRDVRFITPTSLSYGSDDESVNLGAVEDLLASVRAIVGATGRIFFGTFPSELRPEHVSREALQILRRYANNDNLVIGGQSGSQAVLDKSRRGHRVEDVVRAVRLAVEAGFRPNVDLLFGLPGETEADVARTLELAQRLTDLGARIHSHTFMPLPGTPFRDEAPGSLAPLTRRELGRLAAQGKAYGEWQGQAEVAARLAALRDPGKGRPSR